MRALLWCSIAVATTLRLAILLSGPDLDTDAYGHAMVGRFFLDTPADLRIHWVWLPLWHLVHAGVAAAGGALDHARLLNVALGILAPWLLARLLRSTGDEILASVGGALLALWPLGVSLGQSGQPEPLFQVLLLGALLTWEEDHPIATGALLSLAVLCRYEAWVLLPVFLVLALRRGGVRRSFAWVFPGLVVAAWCLVQWQATGEFLWFLRANREFAREASQALGFPWGPEPRFWRMVFWYPVILPAADLRFFALLPLLGLLSIWRLRGNNPLPTSLLASGLVLVLFLSYGWVQRLNLGLHRHLFSLVPLYAALSAQGLRTVLHHFEPLRRNERWLLPSLVVVFLLVRTVPVARWNLEQHRRAFPSARAAVAALRRASLTERDRILCDLSSTEQIGNLPRNLMIRRPASSLRLTDVAALAPGGRLLVVAKPQDVSALRGEARTLFEDQDQVVLELFTPPAGR
ncbi:MAG: glycosyltransferase family 39 protein [Myxococcales bacterium]|nr:glycosyltransferase family 39 protein [Polyangiaceae bacterium]MDW8249029.1 glycosyltransferase family 39 protein [Myxococcales bacterium]